VLLARKVGPDATRRAMQTIRDGGHILVGDDGGDLLAAAQARLAGDRSIEGVVLLGGVDVVPSRITDAVPAELQGLPGLKSLRLKERDRLQVWSDDAYGDLNGDGAPEFPVSRIPDGGDPTLLLGALALPPARPWPGRIGGLRNAKRPFADLVYRNLDANGRMYRSASDIPEMPPYPLTNCDHLYLVLHGNWHEGTVLRGEDEDGYPEAFSTRDIPNPAPQIVFSGCCYGALCATQVARDAQPGAPQQGRTAADSLALAFLKNGTRAFVGCTAVHYSPDLEPSTYLGEPMHRYFWEAVAAGIPPAKALYLAKVKYAVGIPHRIGDKPELAIFEHKILRQFVCLGLGW